MNNIKILFISVFFVMILTIYFFYTIRFFIDKLLLGISIIAQIITLYGCYLVNKYITEIGHCIFGIIVFLISIIGVSKKILILNSFLLILTLLSRSFLKNCMFNFDKDDLKSVTQFYPDLSWGYIYFLLLVISLVRLMYKSKKL